MPLQATSGAASYDAFGGGVPVVPAYIEDVFSTYLYTGTGAAGNIVNNIDLSTKGGMVWLKSRSAFSNHALWDTSRGATKYLSSNATNAEAEATIAGLNAFNTDGFSFGGSSFNGSGVPFASWTFRKQPKFFDVVTWTSDGFSNQTISHSLGVTPAFVIYKNITIANDWHVWALNSSGTYDLLLLNKTDSSYGKFTATQAKLTSTTFNANAAFGSPAGNQLVAYLFASNAGGFGLTGTDNVISCGSFTPDGSGNATVNLGYEPQLVLMKNSATANDWFTFDTMRGFGVSRAASLSPNLTDAETAWNPTYWSPTATGFTTTGVWASQPTIYIAIRRGPMKVPTDATKVFLPIAVNAAAGTQQTTNFPIDMQIFKWRDGADGTYLVDRLRGVTTTAALANNTPYLLTGSSAAEATYPVTSNWNNTGFAIPQAWGSINDVFWSFRRAPSFFDEVCYTGNDAGTRLINHNLGVLPEMLIIRNRTEGANWPVFFPAFDTYTALNSVSGKLNGSPLPSAVTATTFDVGSTTGYSSVTGSSNNSSQNYVSYLFASCAGVSKVGSYTGNGSTQAIACGFTGGARFVLIKRTDVNGGWYVYDTARGMTVLTDPYLFLNSTAAEVATLGSVTTTTGGFTVNATVLAFINASGGTYIFLAIA